MDIIQPFAAVLLVLGLLGAALVVLKKRGAATFHLPGNPAGPRPLQVLDRIPLGAHHSLHLVRAGNRCVLIATAPTSCYLLDADVSLGVSAQGRPGA